ncbi:MAG: hypothetical protein K1X65_05330 [Caldilineales bacterium]|nr:hypothetical protein [Caldilineales bacterium]
MNARIRSWLIAFSWLAGAALVVGLLIFVLGGRWENNVAEAPSVSPLTPPAAVFDSPFATPPVEVWPTPEPTPTPPPTPTIALAPTWPPTPVATRVPVAKPPFIPLPDGEPEPYLLVLRDGHLIRFIDGFDKQERGSLDTFARVGLYPVNRTVGEWEWASPSPDGRQLALVLTNVEPIEETAFTRRVIEFDIYLYDMAKGSLELLIEDAVRPVWSPDGKRMAYRDQKSQAMWILDLGSGQRFEAFSVGYPETEHVANWYTWSPDSTHIAVVKCFDGYAGVGGIWIIETIPNGEQRQVVPMEMYAHTLEWSPTSDDIVFHSLAEERLRQNTPINLWIVNAKSGVYQQLTEYMNVNSVVPIWSRDGKWLVFAAPNQLEDELPPYNLWLLAADGQKLIRLNDESVIDINPIWAPDNQHIVFRRTDNGIWQVDLQTGVFEQISGLDSSFYVMKHNAK